MTYSEFHGRNLIVATAALSQAMFELVDSAQHAADCAMQHSQRILEAQEKARAVGKQAGLEFTQGKSEEFSKRHETKWNQ